MNWPKKKEFAFTIIDDTDNSNINNIKPIYDYLASKNIKTTKTVWGISFKRYIYKSDSSKQQLL
jgi:hypothetical protein